MVAAIAVPLVTFACALLLEGKRRPLIAESVGQGLRGKAVHDVHCLSLAVTRRRCAIEFGGGPLAELSAGSAVELVVSASAGKLVGSRSRRNPATGTWLARFELDPEDNDTVELRAFLKDRDHALTETWSYLWKRA